MDGKARYIFPVLMSGQMVLMVTCIVTLLNLGLRSDFFAQWMRAFFISWPVAASAAFFAIPVARRATSVLMELFDKIV
jgi:hypothetical protein